MVYTPSDRLVEAYVHNIGDVPLAVAQTVIGNLSVYRPEVIEQLAEMGWSFRVTPNNRASCGIVGECYVTQDSKERKMWPGTLAHEIGHQITADLWVQDESNPDVYPKAGIITSPSGVPKCGILSPSVLRAIHANQVKQRINGGNRDAYSNEVPIEYLPQRIVHVLNTCDRPFNDRIVNITRDEVRTMDPFAYNLLKQFMVEDVFSD